jgi:transaldolase
MKPTKRLQTAGQSIWLDNITRDMLDDGTLRTYIDEDSVTGLTSNPSIFDAAIAGSETYDNDIRTLAGAATPAEDIFFEIALADLRRAADMFRAIHETTNGVDGWVSMEVSPLLATDTAGSIVAARNIRGKAQRQNLFVKIPGTREGLPAIEEAIFLGIPINVTLLFSREQYLGAAEAYLRGIERRLAGGMDPSVHCVASLFISRWDVAANPQIPGELKNHLGIAIAGRTYCAYRELLASKRWQTLASRGVLPQRLLWASTGTKDPQAPDTLYVENLAAPDTINTMPDKTLRAFADHGVVTGKMEEDAREAELILAEIARAKVDVDALAETLQLEGTRAFVKSWQQLLQRIDTKARASKGMAPAAAAL